MSIIPGTKIEGIVGQHRAGPGVYEHNGQFYASIHGKVMIEDNLISVKSDKNPAIVLKPNDIVIAQVFRIRDDGVYVRMLQLNDVKVQQHLEGYIKKEYIREKEIDAVKVHKCYLPGDIVRAKFLSFGDGRRVYLSTAGEDLGVMYAKSATSGKLMLPYSWSEMICLKSGVKEERKVAKPNI